MNKNKPPNNHNHLWHGAPGKGFSKARKLRKRMTITEKLLWQELRNKKLKGQKFRRQHPISNYIVDFYCHKLKLVIEIDGKYHETEEQKIKDKKRTVNLERLGLRIIRFTNEEITNNLKDVLNFIENEIIKLTNPL